MERMGGSHCDPHPSALHPRIPYPGASHLTVPTPRCPLSWCPPHPNFDAPPLPVCPPPMFLTPLFPIQVSPTSASPHPTVPSIPLSPPRCPPSLPCRTTEHRLPASSDATSTAFLKQALGTGGGEGGRGGQCSPKWPHCLLWGLQPQRDADPHPTQLPRTLRLGLGGGCPPTKAAPQRPGIGLGAPIVGGGLYGCTPQTSPDVLQPPRPFQR